MTKSKSTPALDCLEEIFQAEMSGVNRYLHYSFMIMGHHRIPIQKWFRAQASEAMDHAIMIGEKITSLGGHPTLGTAKAEETNIHSTDQLLTECLRFEEEGLALYRKLVSLSGDDIALEELARDMVRQETEHVDEVKKMLRSPK